MKYQLYNEDCLTVLGRLANDSIDMTLTSPPYDNLRDYGKGFKWSSKIWKSCIETLYRITSPGGVVVWIVNDATIDGTETGTSFCQALFAKKCGFNLHDTMIWSKGSFTGVGSLKSRYAPSFEYMFVFTKGKIKTFNPIKDRRNKIRGKIRGTIRQPDGSTRRMSTQGKKHARFGQRFSIWEQSPCMSNKIRHPAPFPLALAKDHIRSWSNKGDTILDPFMGSGTTGVACGNLDRQFIGCEIDTTEGYYKIAKKRIRRAYQRRSESLHLW